MSKILKNNTALDVEIADTGVTVLASAQYTIPPQDYATFAASSDVIAKIASLSLTFNDGSSDITNISNAIDAIKGWARDGEKIFDSNTNAIDSVVDLNGVRRLAISVLNEVATPGELFDSSPLTVAGDAVYLSNTNEVDQAIASDVSKKYAIGIVLSKPTATSARVALSGKISGFGALTFNQPIFLSDSILGGITQTPPIGASKWLQVLGVASDSSTIILQVSPPTTRA